MDKQQKNILELIHTSYFQFTAAEQRIADFVLAQYEQVQFMSITQLADECRTADATVSRFCRRLNLKGFNEFKIELAKQSVAQPAAKVEQHSLETQAGRTQEVAKLGQDAVKQTIELLDAAQVIQAVELLEKADHVMILLPKIPVLSVNIEASTWRLALTV